MGQEDASERTLVGKTMNAPLATLETGHFLSYTQPEGLIRVQIPASGLVIGRVAPADLQIPEPNISRRHCQVELTGDGLVLTDLGSTNGTYVEGKRIGQPARIAPGSQFALGNVPIRYERRDLAEIADEALLAEELARAEEYVRAILPAPISAGPVVAEGSFVPSSKLGGDAFGYQFLDADHFVGFVLDVSGHGIGSAMHAANAANSIRRLTLPNVDFRDPAQVASGLNDALPMEEHNGLMITMWAFTYHLPSRTLTYCAAGHHAAYLVRQDQPDPEPVWTRSPAIGMLPGAHYVSASIQMPPFSRLYVFTDGCFELALADGRYWTQEGLRRVIKRPPQPGLPESQRIYQAVRGAARPGPFEDDFSMLVITFNQ